MQRRDGVKDPSSLFVVVGGKHQAARNVGTTRAVEGGYTDNNTRSLEAVARITCKGNPVDDGTYLQTGARRMALLLLGATICPGSLAAAGAFASRRLALSASHFSMNRVSWVVGSGLSSKTIKNN
jgi:hypothetical protein